MPASQHRVMRAGTDTNSGAIIAPAIFVLLWGSGFISSSIVLRYAPPFTLIALRYALAFAIMLPFALITRARWPRGREALHIAFTGILVQDVYLGSVLAAIHHGMSAGLIALITGLQPVITACVAAPFLGERVSARQWLGLALGFAGVALVVEQKIALHGLSAISLFWAFVALAGMTASTLYQKRYCPVFDLRSGTVIQFGAAILPALPIALLTEDMHIVWKTDFVLALTWAVLVTSIGVIMLLNWMIARGEATRVTSLFYLTPPVTALMAYIALGETLSVTALCGMALAVLGVLLVRRR